MRNHPTDLASLVRVSRVIFQSATCDFDLAFLHGAAARESCSQIFLLRDIAVCLKESRHLFSQILEAFVVKIIESIYVHSTKRVEQIFRQRVNAVHLLGLRPYLKCFLSSVRL